MGEQASVRLRTDIMVREAQLMRAFLGRASYEFPSVRLFRRNIGVMQVKDRIFRAGIRGQCDIYGYVRGGIALELEIKAKGKLNPDQIRWRDWCFAWGVPWLLLEAKKDELPGQILERWCQEFRSFLDSLSGIPASSHSFGCTPTTPATPSALEHFRRARSMFEELQSDSEPEIVPKSERS